MKIKALLKIIESLLVFLFMECALMFWSLQLVFICISKLQEEIILLDTFDFERKMWIT